MNTSQDSGRPLIQRFAAGFAHWSNRWIPNSLVFVILLTWVTVAFCLGFTKSTAWDALVAWEKGFWDLLAFAMQMCLAMVTGFVVADSPLVKRWLLRLASVPNNGVQAVLMLGSIGCVVFWCHWAVGVMGISLLGREMLVAARLKGYKLHVPLVAAVTYACFLVCNGPSFPAALFVASKGHLFENIVGIIPVSDTIFHPINFLQMFALAALLLVCAYKFTPADKDTVEASDELIANIKGGTDRPEDAPDMVSEAGHPADRLNNSQWMGILLGLAGCIWVVWTVYTKGNSALNLNFVNFTFLMLGFVLHGSPDRFVRSTNRAIGTVSGVVIQFPLYAGIFGLIKYTGLAQVLVDFFVSFATKETFPLIAFIYSAILNMFVPSSGSKFIIEAPYILPAAMKLGANPAVIINAYTVGDCTTNLIQPFWALPVLGLFKVEFKDILPFGFVACMLAMLINSVFFRFIWI